MLAAMIDNLPELDRNALKNLLRGLVERITLDPKTLAYCIHYQVKLNLGEIGGVPKGIRTPVLTVKG
jgi:hypothetical protein